jgi:hypothetical protein
MPLPAPLLLSDRERLLENDTPDTLAEAMAVLEAGLARWFEEQGVELP